ncbi:hypothetical protein PpBr36_09066 [Pyricularia pennisetigena]|uniref:hypothetical protein n=1 Tax=Pyricularia pennisetigena TaxID=1578925 RepID=UPI0011502ABC|nr:hypothetical protein PpBr36_09066 [Pyricularia pennisetigena]TLS24316.1 hypothetical protein PpBr36_09066 [Pyricularia pennisetigena]
MSSAKRVKLSHSKAPGPFRKPSSGDRTAAKSLTKKIIQAPKSSAPIKQKAHDAEEDEEEDDDEDQEDDDSSDDASENDDSTPTVEDATKDGQTELPSKEETPTKSFRDLGIVEPLCEACEALKFKKPTPIQEQAIPLALQGRDVIGIAETGSGKTAAFALPILQALLEKPQPLFGLVLAPTRELAAQIGQTFEALGASISLRCAVVVGGLDMVSQSIALGKKPHIVVATPGRLLDHLEKTKGFSLRSLKFLVMDEADRLLDLDFGPILDKILKFLPRERRTFLFSATMSSKVESLQRASLRDPLKVSVSSNQEKTVSTLIQNPLFIPHKHKDVYLIYLANEFAGKTTIVFTRTVNEAQRVSILLRTLSFGAIPLHGQLSQSMRLGALNKFKARSRDILVATDVAARGLDIPEVDLVINFDMPQDSMTYIHRVGRTARAGRSGRAISIITQYDLELWLRIEKAALNGRKLPLYQPDKEEVMVFKERVEEAQRHAREEMKTLHEDRGKKGAVLKGLQQDYSTTATTTSSYYGSASPDRAANAPEVVPSDVPPHSRGDNQPQMMGMDWQEKGKPAMQTYYDPKIGTYPESVPVTPPYHAKVASPPQGAPTPSYRNDMDDTPLEAVPGQFNAQPTMGIYTDKVGGHPVETVQELGGFVRQGSGDDGNRALEKPAQRRSKVLGVPVAVFWALLVLIVLGTVGLGAGLGVGLSQRNDGAAQGKAAGAPATDPESQETGTGPTRTTTPTPQGPAGSTSTTTSSTTQAAVTAGTRGLAANSCDFDGSRVYASGADKFEAFCSVDWPQGVGAAGGGGSVVKDVGRALVYSFEACMGECVKYNEKLPDVRCVAVTYNSNLTDFFPIFAANCFLKDKKGQNFPAKDTSACAAML